MELNSGNFRETIFYNFRCGLTQYQCIDELPSIFGDEAPLKTYVYRYGMVNSIEIVVHSKPNFVKVVQNQVLFRKPLNLCADNAISLCDVS